MKVKSAVTIQEYFRVDHPKLGLCEATVLDGTLSDLRICANGSSVEGQGLFTNNLQKALAMRDVFNALMGEVEEAIRKSKEPKVFKSFAELNDNALARDAGI